MDQNEKIRENRIRRAAVRQGLRVEKSRVRDPRAIGWGTYQVVTSDTGKIKKQGLPSGYGLTLDEVEAFLNS